MKRLLSLSAGVAFATGLSFLSGCASPTTVPSQNIPLDSDPLRGAIGSEDIRTVASQMAPEILSVQEVADAADIVRIKMAKFKNTSRFFIDSEIFMKRLSVELNRYGKGKIRFLNNNEKVNPARASVLKNRQSAQIQKNLKSIAGEISKSPILTPNKKVKVAVVPVLNTNLVNMNADSFTAMLRSEIFNATAGKMQFLMPGETKGADYYLTGQFIPETMKTEGIVNLAKYIEAVDARVKAGKSMYIAADKNSSNSSTQITSVKQNDDVTVTTVTPQSKDITLYDNYLREIMNNQSLQVNPNVNKRLNIMLVDAKEKTSVYEKMIMIDQQINDNSGIARYIISGEISGMHARKNGDNTDYLLITVQLTDVETNETVWEDAYEVKRFTQSGIVYK